MNNFIINLNVVKYNFDNITNFISVISGGKPKQISIKTKKN